MAEIGEKPFGVSASIYFAVIAICLVKFQLKRSRSNPAGLHFAVKSLGQMPKPFFLRNIFAVV